ncbi:cell division cycle protein 27 homolog [Nilaparvata lugens]|uniref:cell division cycle protein 27 homolog n=1 Tax=Nilaparvata lugens TaxID=108931 RepID=UPI00193D4C3C|nr:cell division cycle protein 27 homolog [Nilaparvata lugens]
MLVQEPVKAAIWHCLNHYAYPDAIFLAERLRAEVDSEDTLFLLATCYYRSGKPAQAYSLLNEKGANSPQCKYLLAKCCLELNKLSEAESALTGGGCGGAVSLDDVTCEFGEAAGFALALVARVCYASDRTARGADAYRRALRVNPFLWHSFEELCHRGEKPDPNKVFSLNSLDNLSAIIGSSQVASLHNVTVTANANTSSTYCEPLDHVYVNSSSTPVQVQNVLSSNIAISGIRPQYTPEETVHSTLNSHAPKRNPCKEFTQKLFSNISYSPFSPSFGVFPIDYTSSPSDVITSPMAPSSMALPPSTLTEANDQKGLSKRMMNRKDTPLHQSKPVFSQCSGNLTSPSAPPTPHAHSPLQSAQNVRRSSRLFSNSYSVKENNKSPNRNKFVTPKSPRKVKSRISKTNLNKPSYTDLNERNRVVGGGGGGGGGVVGGGERAETITGLEEANAAAHQTITRQALSLQKQSIEGLMSLLREIGTAYLHLSQYNCQKAIACLNDLPLRHYNSGWVLCVLGKAHFEMNDFQQAIKLFSRVRQLEPYRQQLMEVLSTALWQLQREAQLSVLAQELIALDRHSPAAWCAAGNCFSLQKEHDTAIKFFHRAVQVDPNFVYAYTLLGHEYVITEELEKAMSCFRNAIRICPRHYNAWYGIGTIYSKQERFKLAELHFRSALKINPNNAVLMCHIGVMQNALMKTEEALQTLNAALEKEPRNPLCKFHRASIYFAAGRHAEALHELQHLKTIVPKESLVYYLTGKVYKKLGQTHLALMHFSWATDLDPKGANSQIKEAIDPAISRSQAEESCVEFVNGSNAGLTPDASLEAPLVIQESDEGSL